MKLISMTDFVLEQDITLIESKFRILYYAKFLKQPLELWMFVPCVDNEVFNYSKHGNKEQYQEAKERCFFEGFECKEIYEWGFLKIWFDDFEVYIDLIKKDTIEDLLTYSVDFDLELTQTAIKQLGL